MTASLNQRKAAPGRKYIFSMPHSKPTLECSASQPMTALGRDSPTVTTGQLLSLAHLSNQSCVLRLHSKICRMVYGRSPA